MFTKLSDNVWRFEDTCNVYVIRRGNRCVLIDSGSGAVAQGLSEIGVTGIDWVLHTHHHRDQCWGTSVLQTLGAKIAVPEYERHLFEDVEAYWQSKRIYDNYNDSNSIFSLGKNLRIDAILEDYEHFQWEGLTFRILPAKGHTYGMACLITEIDGQRMAFTGDLMVQGGKLYQLHAMEYSYGDLLGVEMTMQSILALKKERVQRAYPSHGDPITQVNADIECLEARLEDLAGVGRLGTSGALSSFKDSVMIRESRLQPISKHLLWAGPYTCSNFYVVLSGHGHAMLIDYGLVSSGHLHWGPDADDKRAVRFVEHHLEQLREDYGVKHIELVVPTHIHDDHVCGIPYLQRHFGTQCWALDCIADVLTAPAAWASTPCCFDKPSRVDSWLRDRETFHWRGFDFCIYHAPGQTKYHAFIVGEIDGKRVGFGGDNILFLNGTDLRSQKAMQSTVLRNSFQLKMHRHCAELMRNVQIDLMCPGHGELFAIDHARIEGYTQYIARKEDVFRDVVDAPADHFIDLFWVRMLPYLSETRAGETRAFTLKIRNNFDHRVTYEARLLGDHGWTAATEFTCLCLDPSEIGELTVEARAPTQPARARKLLTVEMLIDGISQGPVCEALVSTISD